ncbi:MAG TPA: PAS domain S-box protein [Polyangia bacterium]|nr:PAS domain S-box protein [Polyangia bacterium]
MTQTRQATRRREITRPQRANSADQFQLLVESVRDYAIFMLDPGGRVQTWNAGAEIIKGYAPGEIIGRHLSVFYTPEDQASGHASELLAEAVRNGRVEDEGWRVRKDGTRFWADVIITALRDESGELSGFAKVTRDLTERRNAEEERRRREDDLRRSEERFRLLVDSVEDYAIFMLDPDGYVMTWNSGAERLKGYSADDIIGKHFSCFRLEEDVRAGKCEQELEAAARDGRVEEEGWRLRKDGTKFWASVVLAAIRNASGELLGFAKVTRDLTERVRLDNERLHRVRAEEAVRLRDEFLSIASHELKTPLTALQIELHSWQEQNSDHAGQAEGDERVAKRYRRAVRNAERLSALVESLLDVSRIATGRLVLKPERMDLSETVSQVIDSLCGAAAKARCDILFSTPGTIDGSWDRLRVDQVVMNVLSNALKYGAGAPIRVSLSVDQSDAVIEIADRGPGIPDQDLERIFGRFERASPVRHYGGLGLGLYVARRIVEVQGGSIAARNMADGGACFTIRLPIQPSPTSELSATSAAH